MADAAVVEHTMSPDGTRIAGWRAGAGPPLVLVHGATGAHWSFDLLAPLLRERFTLHAIDRRGRGESGEVPPYAIEREFEDVAAVVDSLVEPAAVLGHSYGATVALGAALLARNLGKLILYEASPGDEVAAEGEIDRIDELVAAGRGDEALVHTYRLVGFTPEEIEGRKAAPGWEERVASAHTIAREFRAEQAYRPDPVAFRRMTTPTLFLLGEESPDWAHEGTERIRALLPNAKVALLPGQGHAATVTAPELVAAAITPFLLR